MNQEAKIGKRTFLSALVILFLLLVGAGILTQVVPMGQYQYKIEEGQQVVIPDSFSFIKGERLPVYQWFLAPFSVLFSEEGIVVIMIIAFLLIIGGAIHVLNQVGVLGAIIGKVIYTFQGKKYLLLRMVMLLFMSLGAFVGIFEEVIPLVPIIIALSIGLGFDVMTGLGMSLLATGFGFAAAVSNPFTIGVAQKIADIPIFSGAGYRLIIFVVVYGITSSLLVSYGKKIEKKQEQNKEMKRTKWDKSTIWFLACMAVMAGVLVSAPFIPIISSLNLPIIALIFLLAGWGSGLLSSLGFGKTARSFGKGMLSMFPGVGLILLATGVKHIIQTGNIMDTLLYYASQKVMGASPFVAVLLVYGLVFFLNFFIGSGSAKAFIVIPIIAPLMDMMGISRQMAVLAFQFGDGFSNILYPTNAVLLIGIGLAGVSYGKWFRWVLKYQVIVLLCSFFFLFLGLQFGY